MVWRFVCCVIQGLRAAAGDRLEENDRLARQLAWLGINKDTYARSNAGTYKWKYDVDYVGYKYNGNAIMAAIALVQLKYLDEENARRREIISPRGFSKKHLIHDPTLRSLLARKPVT